MKIQCGNIYQGDNLYFMADIPDESIDLIYIDPPFGTQSLWQSRAFTENVQELQFYDIWGGGIHGYIEFMVERLRHMHRLLKPTGSLFVHLDWRTSHYIKIELDKIFEVKNPASSNTNFVNEIVWCYGSGGASKRHFSKKHDTILFYAKNKSKYQFFCDPVREPYKEKCKVKYKIINNKKYLRKHKLGRIPFDWFEMPCLTNTAKERVGWPTQKPLRLLERIIKATTKENDIVADFFCGCGTAIVAAQRLNRRWIGIDASKTACEVMLERIKEDQPLLNHKIVSKPLTGKDFRDLPPFEFEKAAVRYVGGVTNHAQVGDGGIDGRLAFDGTPIQVKKEDKPLGDVDRFRAFYLPIKQHGRGIYITLKGYSKKAKERAAGWRNEGLDIQLLTVDDVLAGKCREQPLKK